LAVSSPAVFADSLELREAAEVPAAGPSSGHCIAVAAVSISSVWIEMDGFLSPVCVFLVRIVREPKRVCSSYAVRGAASYSVMSTSRSCSTPGRMSARNRIARCSFIWLDAWLGGAMKRRCGGSSYAGCAGSAMDAGCCCITGGRCIAAGMLPIGEAAGMLPASGPRAMEGEPPPGRATR
jgi:hypothetical protein